MASAYYNNMIRRVLDASHSDCWEDAVYEWKSLITKKTKIVSPYAFAENKEFGTYILSETEKLGFNYIP